MGIRDWPTGHYMYHCERCKEYFTGNRDDKICAVCADKERGRMSDKNVKIIDYRPVIRFKKMAGFEDFLPPVYQTAGAAAVDLYAAIDNPFLYLNQDKRTLIFAGFSMALPGGYEGQVRGRSGLALKKGLGVLNAPGTIDSDYRGPIGVILINHGEERIRINRGDRIAQLVISRVSRPEWIEGDLCDTDRGEGGFGSTG